MNYYLKIHELILIEAYRNQGFSDDQINEIFTLAGLAGRVAGPVKRVIGSRADFVHNYNQQIDASNKLRGERGHPLLRRWGEKAPPEPGSGAPPPETKPDAELDSRVRGKSFKLGKFKVDPRIKRPPPPDTKPDTSSAELKRKIRTPEQEDERAKNIKHAATVRKLLPKDKAARADMIDALKKGVKYAKRGRKDATQADIRLGQAVGLSDRAKKYTGDVRKDMEDQANLVAQNASTYYGDIANLIRESFQLNEKKGPCWKGYEAVGMKMKGGRKVPNCVPKKK
jgi:hypothetical protein